MRISFCLFSICIFKEFSIFFSLSLSPRLNESVKNANGQCMCCYFNRGESMGGEQFYARNFCQRTAFFLLVRSNQTKKKKHSRRCSLNLESAEIIHSRLSLFGNHFCLFNTTSSTSIFSVVCASLHRK